MDAYRRDAEAPCFVTPESSSRSTVMIGIAAEVNAEHAAALRHAGDAIEHARHAGELLLRAKAQLPHGNFLPWLANNCAVSDRQAQRYMRAAQGKPMPLRAIKSDTRVASGAWAEIDQHRIAVEPLQRMFGFVKRCAGPVSMSMYVVEPSQNVGFFYVSKIDVHRESGDGVVECLRRPIAERVVGYTLHKQMGAPRTIEWECHTTDPAVVPWARQFMGVAP